MEQELTAKLSGVSHLVSLLKKAGARLAYLFGSRVDGTETGASDLDLALYFGCGTPTDRFRRASELQRTIQAEVAREVDVVVLDDATPVLRFEAMKPACVAYSEDEESLARLELKWFREFEEYHYRQLQYMKDLAAGLEDRRKCSTTQ
jgi:predicted nucleotidyltransferase